MTRPVAYAFGEDVPSEVSDQLKFSDNPKTNAWAKSEIVTKLHGKSRGWPCQGDHRPDSSADYIEKAPGIP